MVNSDQLFAALSLAENALQVAHKLKNQQRPNADYEPPDLDEANVSRIYSFSV